MLHSRAVRLGAQLRVTAAQLGPPYHGRHEPIDNDMGPETMNSRKELGIAVRILFATEAG